VKPTPLISLKSLAMAPAMPRLELDACSDMDKLMVTPMSKSISSTNQSTALATRTTQDVIADLKRPLELLQTIPVKRCPVLIEDIALKSQLRKQWVSDISNTSLEDEDEEQEQDQDIDDADLDELIPMTKPRKVSERKRRAAAIADSYIEAVLQKTLKDGISTVKPGEESTQSARWLVSQSESHQIISTPRTYQIELFELAKEKNVIAVLDTGSGKTLIAVLLLRHTFAQELEDRAVGKPKRVSFFLVDSVTLLFQQHAVLKANLDQPMDLFCGDMGCDLWSRDIWEKHMNENMVIVCTAEVLRHCLAHAFIPMEKINLLIFDEAHHAKKSHPYARIIMDHYARQPKHAILPRIFGMTASPVDSRTDVKRAATELETILHSQIITAADGTLGGHKVTSKQEQLARYKALPPPFKTALYEQMHSRFNSNSILRKPLHFAFEASRDLGAWCSDQVWPSCLDDEESKKLLSRTEKHYHGRRIPEPLHVLESRKAQLKEANELVKAHIFEKPDYNSDSLVSSNLSSKVVLLIQYLRERFERPTDDKAIVFVRQRYTARLLAQLFQHSHICTEHLRVGTLVGTRSGDAGDLKVSFRDQVITMMKFRKGDINCLFATSVAEEGLDIPDCNLVIRFDLYTTLIQYIQSKGRARQNNSRFIHMHEDGNNEHASIIREVRINEGILEKFCRALPEDRKLLGKEGDIDHFLAKEKSHRVYVVPETGARLTYKMSLMVLANFVDSLLVSPDILANPEYIVTVQNKEFICEVILPESSPIRGAIGRPHSTKAVARCSAAFETCVLLREGKYLDENLLPIFTKQLPAMRNALLAVDSKKREAFNMRTKPDLWSVKSVPNELYLTILSLEDCQYLERPSQPLAMLTRTMLPPLPSFLLHFGAGKNSPVQLTPLVRSLKVTELLLGKINMFTLCIFDDVFSKEYVSDIEKTAYFLVPIKADASYDGDSDPVSIVAWDIISHVTLQQEEWIQRQESQRRENKTLEKMAQQSHKWENQVWKGVPDEFFEDKFIVDPYDGSRKLWSVKVTQKYKPLDPVPPGSAIRKGTRRNNNNILEYSCSLWTKARERVTFDEKQPVIEAKVISLRRNLLDPFDASSYESQRCYIVIEPLKISPLPTTVVSMAYLFPAIVHRLESYLIALDGCALLHLNIRPDLALEAFTKDSDNSGEHGDEQINFQRGMGNNYERL